MALSEHYELRYLDPDAALSDFPSQWDHVIDKIDTGIHDAATAPVSLSRLPNLPASKTTSGTFADARIPSSIARSSTVAGDISDGDAATLSAAKAYTDDAATAPVSLSRLPNLPASKTTSGTFDPARIPELEAEKIPELSAFAYNSGVRNIESLLFPDFTSAWVRITRVGPLVSLFIANLAYSGEDTGTVGVLHMPDGFEPPYTAYTYTTRGRGAFITRSGAFQISGPSASVDSMSFTYITTNPAPATAPGLPD